MKPAEFYDQDYYERGIETGKSTVISGYTWRPELTFPLAAGILRITDLPLFADVLDFGCAKGYLVKALRLLLRNAYGCDWSEYAVAEAPDDVRAFVRHCAGPACIPWPNIEFDLAIAKDVLEHQTEENLGLVLRRLRSRAQSLLVILPLGDEQGRHVIPSLDQEISHGLVRPKDWWRARITEAGWDIVKSFGTFPGIKPQWTAYPNGNLIAYAK